jgi:hypothetical protein
MKCEDHKWQTLDPQHPWDAENGWSHEIRVCSQCELSVHEDAIERKS